MCRKLQQVFGAVALLAEAVAVAVAGRLEQGQTSMSPWRRANTDRCNTAWTPQQSRGRGRGMAIMLHILRSPSAIKRALFVRHSSQFDEDEVPDINVHVLLEWMFCRWGCREPRRSCVLPSGSISSPMATATAVAAKAASGPTVASTSTSHAVVLAATVARAAAAGTTASACVGAMDVRQGGGLVVWCFLPHEGTFSWG